MFCPTCHTEYRPGFTRCSDCDVDLVHELPKGRAQRSAELRGRPDPDLQLVPVFTSADPSLCVIAESVLRGADIVFLAQMRELEDKFGADPTINRHHAYEYWVAEDDADEARDLLNDLENSEPLEEDADIDREFEDVDEAGDE